MNIEEPEINQSLVDPLVLRAPSHHKAAFLVNLNDPEDDLHFE